MTARNLSGLTMVRGLDAPLAGWVLLPLYPGWEGFPGQRRKYYSGVHTSLPANLVFSWREIKASRQFSFFLAGTIGNPFSCLKLQPGPGTPKNTLVELFNSYVGFYRALPAGQYPTMTMVGFIRTGGCHGSYSDRSHSADPGIIILFSQK